MHHEKKLWLKGVSGKLEAIWHQPANKRDDYVAILAHPHPLYDGTMNNKVITTLAKTFAELGIPSLRFNYPGVGQSEGEYGHGDGEALALIKIAKALLKEKPHAKLILAGFSFGTYVSTKASSEVPTALLISLAPSVENFDFSPYLFTSNPWLITIPKEDEVVDAKAAIQFFEDLAENIKVTIYEKCSHFFHGQLVTLRKDLNKAIKEALFL